MTKTKNIIKDVIIVAVGVAAIWIGLQVVFGTQNPFYVVSSGSMIPVLEVYDVLVVNGNEPFENIQVGDIIVFNRPNGHDRVIVHRVEAILDDRPESKTIRTKGDANPISIPGTDYPITEEEYIGKVFYVVPQIGYVTRILAPPINYIIIAVIIGIMIVKQYTGKSKEKKEPKFETEASENLDISKEEAWRDGDFNENFTRQCNFNDGLERVIEVSYDAPRENKVKLFFSTDDFTTFSRNYTEKNSDNFVRIRIQPSNKINTSLISGGNFDFNTSFEKGYSLDVSMRRSDSKLLAVISKILRSENFGCLPPSRFTITAHRNDKFPTANVAVEILSKLSSKIQDAIQEMNSYDLNHSNTPKDSDLNPNKDDSPNSENKDTK